MSEIDSSFEGKTIRCKAAVLREVNKPLSIEEIDVAPPKVGEVRVKIIATALCHSDLHVVFGSPSLPARLPMVLGHEAAGIVESVGEGVESVQRGDHVLTIFLPQCRKCSMCKNPDLNICELGPLNFEITAKGTLRDGTFRFKSTTGEDISHFTGISSFSQYTVISDAQISKIPATAHLENICLLSCGIGTGYGAAINSAKVTNGSTCVVFGLGTIGMAAVMGCKAKGASMIIGVDVNPGKEAIARECGITHFLNPKDYHEPVEKVIISLTPNGGCDFAFECIGITKVMESAFNSLKVHGICVIIGLADSDEPLKINPGQLLVAKTVTGCLYGGYKAIDGSQQLVEDYLNKKFNSDILITHRMPLEDINQSIDLMKQGKSLRTVINMF